MSEKVRISFYIEKNVHLKVKQLALNQETTATALYNKWIKEALKNIEKQDEKA